MDVLGCAGPTTSIIWTAVSVELPEHVIRLRRSVSRDDSQSVHLAHTQRQLEDW